MTDWPTPRPDTEEPDYDRFAQLVTRLFGESPQAPPAEAKCADPSEQLDPSQEKK